MILTTTHVHGVGMGQSLACGGRAGREKEDGVGLDSVRRSQEASSFYPRGFEFRA